LDNTWGVTINKTEYDFMEVSTSLCQVLILFLSMLFNDNSNFWDYRVSVMDDWMNMESWWNDTDTEELYLLKL